MNTPTRIGGYALGVAALFGGAFGIGGLTGPGTDDPDKDRTAAHGSADGGHGAGGEDGGHSEGAGDDKTSGGDRAAAPAKGPLPGLNTAQDGYRLVVTEAPQRPGQRGTFAFKVLGPDGEPVTRFTPQHEKKLHLITARRDLSGFAHVHPEMDPDGTWRVRLAWAGAGTQRVFADFDPAGAQAPLTLGTDVHVAGGFTPRPLPEPNRTADAGDGYRVRLKGSLKPGAGTLLTLEVSRNGKPVTDLQPYLGAYGHLVALRDGDLAYLHVHPEDGKPGPGVAFHAEAPSAGAYRLFLDFKHGGTVRTAEFTVVAGVASDTPQGYKGSEDADAHEGDGEHAH